MLLISSVGFAVLWSASARVNKKKEALLLQIKEKNDDAILGSPKLNNNQTSWPHYYTQLIPILADILFEKNGTMKI